jgi:hypothetical protein
MKRLIVAMACLALLGGCKMFHRKPAEVAPAPVKVQAQPQLVDADGVPIERVPFRAGVSSVTVENMARQQGCVGGVGAGLMTEPGPVEVYRMICDNGKVFRAKCEMRQCKAM